MLPIFRIIIISIVASCLLTPLVYEGLINWGWNFPFSRVFDRVMVLFVLITVLFERKRIDLGQVKHYLKSGNFSSNIKMVGLGALVSVLTSMLAGSILFNLGKIYWDTIDPGLAMKMVTVIAPALLISLIEESFFRVILFMGMVKRLGVINAALVSSVIYGVAHLVVPHKSYQYPGLSFSVGFEYVGAVVSNILQVQQSLPFCGLAILGLVLCTIIYRTKSFYLCLGMHAGLVFSVKFTIFSIEFVAPALVHRRNYMVSEPIVWLSFLLAMGIVLLLKKGARA